MPKFESLDKLVEFFETSDPSEKDELPEVDFDIWIRKKTDLIAIDENLASEVPEIAGSKKVSSEN